jgi:hypothetical protein
VHHADRGRQYTSPEFANRLSDWNLRASYGSTGDCFGNAAMESTWATVKRDVLSIHVDSRRLETHHAVRAADDSVRLHRNVLQPAATPGRTATSHSGRDLRCLSRRIKSHNNFWLIKRGTPALYGPQFRSRCHETRSGWGDSNSRRPAPKTETRGYRGVPVCTNWWPYVAV